MGTKSEFAILTSTSWKDGRLTRPIAIRSWQADGVSGAQHGLWQDNC